MRDWILRYSLFGRSGGMLSIEMAENPARSRVTVPSLLKQKAEGRPIVMTTAYDSAFARLIDQSDVDVILVGDSVGMVMQGHANTLPVTLDEIVYHTKCVRRTTRYVHIVSDLPFMSYQVSDDDAVRAAGRLVKEGGAESVKLEGGATRTRAIERIVEAGIPVMGHIGLTPQSVHKFGGFRVQGRDSTAARKLLDDALALQEAGVFSVVLEGIPSLLATEITSQLDIPTIGIGAGNGCDGQVLVMHDLLGLDEQFQPRYVKRFAELAELTRTAFNDYAAEVRQREFPSSEHSFNTKPKTLKSKDSAS